MDHLPLTGATMILSVTNAVGHGPDQDPEAVAAYPLTMGGRHEGETPIQQQERLAGNAELRGKWLVGFAVAVTFGPAQFVILGVFLLFGWTIPQMGTLEIVVFLWAGPAALLWLAAHHQGKVADRRRALARAFRENKRKDNNE